MSDLEPYRLPGFKPRSFGKNVEFCDTCKNDNQLRISMLRAQHGLWGCSRLRKDGLIAFLWDEEPIPMPMPVPLIRPEPPKPTSLLPHPLKVHLFHSYWGGGRGLSEFWIQWKEQNGLGNLYWRAPSVANLMSRKLCDLDKIKAQMTAWTQFRIEVKDGDRNVINVDVNNNVFNSQMTKVVQKVT